MANFGLKFTFIVSNHNCCSQKISDWKNATKYMLPVMGKVRKKANQDKLVEKDKIFWRIKSENCQKIFWINSRILRLELIFSQNIRHRIGRSWIRKLNLFLHFGQNSWVSHWKICYLIIWPRINCRRINY